MFQLTHNSKFAYVALRGANVASEALAKDLELADGLWILGRPPVSADETWTKWLGTIKAGALNESNLVIVARAPSACPFVVDGENHTLERRCLNVLIGLGLYGLWFDGPGIILNGCNLDEDASEPTQVRQVHDSACYRRLQHTIPPTLAKGALVAAGTRAALRANIAETLLVHSITEQGGKEIQHEEHEDILSGPVRRAQ